MPFCEVPSCVKPHYVSVTGYTLPRRVQTQKNSCTDADLVREGLPLYGDYPYSDVNFTEGEYYDY